MINMKFKLSLGNEKKILLIQGVYNLLPLAYPEEYSYVLEYASYPLGLMKSLMVVKRSLLLKELLNGGGHVVSNLTVKGTVPKIDFITLDKFTVWTFKYKGEIKDLNLEVEIL